MGSVIHPPNPSRDLQTNFTPNHTSDEQVLQQDLDLEEERALQQQESFETTMGNICAFVRKEKKKTQPPQSLEDLLKSIPTQEPLTPERLKMTYDENLWLQKFDEHLQKLDLQEERIALEFIVFTQYYWNQIRVKRKPDLNMDRKRALFLAAANRYLLGDIGGGANGVMDMDEDLTIALDNQQLYNDLLATTNSVRAGLRVSEESLDEILKAREDPLIWSEGLDPKYKTFLNTVSMNTMHACILSLL